MPRDLLLVFISLFFWGVGEGMFIYFQPLYLQQWGANPLTIGAILGSVGVAMSIAQIPAGYLSDRIGTRPVMWASWILGAISCGIMAAARSLPVFIVGLLLYSSTSFVVAPMNAYITAVRGNWSVERALTVISFAYNLGMVAGPVLGGQIGEKSGLRSIYLISTGVFTLSTLIILVARRAPIEEHHPSTAERPNVLRNPRFLTLLALIFVTMFSIYLPQPLTPNFLQNQAGLTIQQIGQMGAVGSLGNAIVALTLGALHAPVGLVAGQVLVGIFALLMWKGSGPAWYALGYFFIGGYRLSRSMALAYTRYLVNPLELGLAFGLVETANSTSIILAPLVAGLLYEANPRSMYSVSLAVIALMVIVNLILLPSRKTIIAEQAAGQVIYPRSE